MLDLAELSERYQLRRMQDAGYGRLLPGIDKGSPQSTHFWK